MDAASKSDLALVSTEDLWDELSSRFDASILAGYKARTDTAGLVQKFWDGHTLTCLGLTIEIQTSLQHVCPRSEDDEELDDDDL